ncbi:MAG: hypothetical protein JST73_12945 [Actinobacteria bacterium]|nr:hypothetical protein [Actinomycetota bacterium]
MNSGGGVSESTTIHRQIGGRIPRRAADLFAAPSVDLVDFGSDVAAIASTLEDFHGDPADRIPYGSAQVTSRPLITKDRRIRSYARSTGDVSTIW